VAPLAVAKADHRVHLGEEHAERARVEQRVEAKLGIGAHDHAVEPIAHGARVDAEGGLEIARRDDAHQLRQVTLLGSDRGHLQRVHRVVDVARCGRCSGIGRIHRGRHFFEVSGVEPGRPP
jgi:hypothetical protein